MATQFFSFHSQFFRKRFVRRDGDGAVVCVYDLAGQRAGGLAHVAHHGVIDLSFTALARLRIENGKTCRFLYSFLRRSKAVAGYYNVAAVDGFRVQPDIRAPRCFLI